MNLTAHLTKTPTTWGEIQIGNILDGYMITEVEYNEADDVRVYFYQGGGWSAWKPVTRPVSVWR